MAREAALGIALREGSDPAETLEEYAWRSLIARVRVRDYCEGATFAVCAVSVQCRRHAWYALTSVAVFLGTSQHIICRRCDDHSPLLIPAEVYLPTVFRAACARFDHSLPDPPSVPL